MALVKSITGSYTLGFVLLAVVAAVCLIVLQRVDVANGRPVGRAGPPTNVHNVKKSPRCRDFFHVSRPDVIKCQFSPAVVRERMLCTLATTTTTTTTTDGGDDRRR
jgi:hypothetical protein